MHPLSHRWRSIAAAVPVILFAACGRDTPASPDQQLRAAHDILLDGPLARNIAGEVQLQIGQQTLIKTKNSRVTRTPVWVSSNPAVASVNPSGVVTGVSAGQAMVTVSGFATNETYLVGVQTPPTVTAVTLAPQTGTALAPGQLRQFSTAVTWSDGTTRAAIITYSVSNTGAGTISPTGLFTAGQLAGTVSVIATCACVGMPTVADTVQLSVASLSALSISPKTVTVAPGATQQFSASALWSNGATLMPGVEYSAPGASISPSGQYTAPTTPGTYRVILAQVGGPARDTATVTVPAPQLTALTISPKTVSLAAGATRQFTATANWSTGATTLPPITYSVIGGGTVSLTGLYTAPTAAGTYRVVVAHTGGTLRDTATITVAGATPTLTSLTISPKTVSLPTGGTQQFSASALWSNGTTSLPTVAYSVVGGGTVSGTGFFTAPATAGTYRVVVAHSGGTLRDTATVTVQAQQSPTSNTFGPGPNAPAWSGKTVYQEELFNTPIPVHFSAANSAGFKGWQGFDGFQGTTIYTPTRVTYPTVSTPLGTKPVLRITFPGSSRNLSGMNQITAAWPTNQAWSVQITGSWTGKMVFERSSNNGESWAPISLIGARAGSGTASSSASQTTVNGVWVSQDALTEAGGRFRVRMVEWTSGTATVDVGMQGGAAPARMSAGGFNQNPTRIYTRALIFVDPNWTLNNNTGTKFFFFSQQQGNNHFTGVMGGSGAETHSGMFVGLQQTSFRNMPGNIKIANGTWWDVEFLFIANTPGSHNGIAKAWINGVQAVNANDVMYFAASTVPGFSNLWMDPTYGGGAAPPPRDIYFQLAGWYRESAP